MENNIIVKSIKWIPFRNLERANEVLYVLGRAVPNDCTTLIDTNQFNEIENETRPITITNIVQF